MKKISLFLLFFFSAAILLFAEDDFQFWPRFSLKAIDTQWVDFVHYMELRLADHVSRPKFWQTGEKLQLSPWKYLGFALGYTYLEDKLTNSKTQETEYKFQHRLELEVNPQWKSDWFSIFNRNRIEFRWIEDQGSDHPRYRQMWELEIPVKKVLFLKSIYANNEIFIDFNKRELTENRVTPAGITVRLHKNTQLKVFYMIQSKKGARDWSSNQVLGTHFVVSF